MHTLCCYSNGDSKAGSVLANKAPSFEDPWTHSFRVDMEETPNCTLETT